MTTCREIVRAAFEEIGALVGSEPEARDGELGMRRLNALIAGLSGLGIGEALSDLHVTENRTLPANCRAVVGASGLTLALPSDPQDGSRVQIVSTGAGPVTVARNGRLLEGAATDLVGEADRFSRTWFYRADLADWRRAGEALSLGDDFPFPAETEEAFTVLLAYRLAPPAGPSLSAESQAAARRAISLLRARYGQRTRVAVEEALLRGAVQAHGAGR